MKPVAAVQEPLHLAGETLNLLAWHIPDLVAYQHTEHEYWFAPLDDTFPLVRLNDTGVEMLRAMNGHTTVGRTAGKIWGENLWTGWPAGTMAFGTLGYSNYSLCYFGTEPPGGHRHKAKWDMLLQQIRKAGQDRTALRGKTTSKIFTIMN